MNRFNPDLPFSKLPEELKEVYLDYARFLLKDLKENKLHVVLIDAPYPYNENGRCKIRVADSSNPSWYSSLYHKLKMV